MNGRRYPNVKNENKPDGCLSELITKKKMNPEKIKYITISPIQRIPFFDAIENVISSYFQYASNLLINVLLSSKEEENVPFPRNKDIREQREEAKMRRSKIVDNDIEQNVPDPRNIDNQEVV